MRSIGLTVNGRRVEEDVEPRPPRGVPPRSARPDRHPRGLRARRRAVRARCRSTARRAKSCTMLAVQADGARSTTIEGLAQTASSIPCSGVPGPSRPAMRLLHAGHDHDADEYCSSNPDPSEEEVRAGAQGNLCRCTGYQDIVAAVLAAAKAQRDGRHDGQGLRRRPSAQGGPAAARSARAATSTTSSCPACCTRRSCVARTRTPRIARIDSAAAGPCPAWSSRARRPPTLPRGRALAVRSRSRPATRQPSSRSSRRARCTCR